MRARNLVVIAAVAAGCDAMADRGGDRDVIRKLVEIRDRMHVRFAATNGIRIAITHGDLRRAQVEARNVAGLDEPDILPQWKPYVENVRAAALAITESEDAATAATQLAILGWRCAQCHEAVPGTKTGFQYLPAPPRDVKLAATMAGHQWAIARMWEGLVRPSTQRWNEGAAALAKAPLAIIADGEVPGRELGIAADVARIRLLATRASKAKLAFDRAQTYGQLLATCANCHHTIRDDSRSTP